MECLVLFTQDTINCVDIPNIGEIDTLFCFILYAWYYNCIILFCMSFGSFIL